MEENQNNNKSKKNIKKQIIIEYIGVLVIIFTYWGTAYLNYIVFKDSLFVIFVAFIYEILKYIIAVIWLIINPIRILIFYRLQLKEIVPKIKKVLYIFITVFPIFVGILILFDHSISMFIYKLKYDTSWSSYSVDSNDYKTAKEFEKELTKRGLIYNDDYKKLLLKLNKKYNIGTQYYKKYYYEETSVMTSYSNNINDLNYISFNSNTKAPVYIYNFILTIPDKGENLQYAPIGIIEKESSVSKTKPYWNDYYIKGKILYVDGNIYAIIGEGESSKIDRYFSNNSEKYNSKNWSDLPYNMILSEKDTITTYVNGKYHSRGAISGFEMKLNTYEASYDTFKNYPVRKVNKLDVETINNIAKELQEGILKDFYK